MTWFPLTSKKETLLKFQVLSFKRLAVPSIMAWNGFLKNITEKGKVLGKNF